MQGDFSRDSFDPKKQFTRVLLRQGRLIVDADWNEQTAIILNYLRALTADVIGWHGGPGVAKTDGSNEPGTGAFAVSLDTSTKTPVIIGPSGRYYVDGWMVEQEKNIDVTNENAPDATLPNRLVFLEIWERHVTVITDPSLLDPALGGLDTSTRLHVEVRAKYLWTDIPKIALVDTITLTGTTTNSSTAVTGLPSTTSLVVGMTVSGVNVDAGTTIAAIANATSITLSKATLATGAATGPLTFVGAHEDYVKLHTASGFRTVPVKKRQRF